MAKSIVNLVHGCEFSAEKKFEFIVRGREKDGKREKEKVRKSNNRMENAHPKYLMIISKITKYRQKIVMQKREREPHTESLNGVVSTVCGGMANKKKVTALIYAKTNTGWMRC